MRVNSVVFATHRNTVRALSSYLLSVKVELVTNRCSTSVRTTSTVLSTGNNYRDAAGGMEPMLPSRSARKPRNRAIDADFFDVSFEKMDVLIFRASPSHGQSFTFLTLIQVLLHHLIYRQQCGTSVALPHSAYSITCYWIITSVVIIYSLYWKLIISFLHSSLPQISSLSVRKWAEVKLDFSSKYALLKPHLISSKTYINAGLDVVIVLGHPQI